MLQRGSLIGLTIERGGIVGYLWRISRGLLFLGGFGGLGLVGVVGEQGGKEFFWNHGLDGDLDRHTCCSVDLEDEVDDEWIVLSTVVLARRAIQDPKCRNALLLSRVKVINPARIS
jgi:hypothetical protein